MENRTKLVIEKTLYLTMDNGDQAAISEGTGAFFRVCMADNLSCETQWIYGIVKKLNKTSMTIATAPSKKCVIVYSQLMGVSDKCPM